MHCRNLFAEKLDLLLSEGFELYLRYIFNNKMICKTIKMANDLFYHWIMKYVKYYNQENIRNEKYFQPVTMTTWLLAPWHFNSVIKFMYYFKLFVSRYRKLKQLLIMTFKLIILQ